VFEAGATAEGRPYFAMEYVRGESITAYCARHKVGSARPHRSLPAGLRRRPARASEGRHPPRPEAVEHPGDAPDDRPVPKIIDSASRSHDAAVDRSDAAHELGTFIGTPST
jgi:hypothetical protein